MADAPRAATVVLVHGACPEGADAHAAAWADAAKGHDRRPVIETTLGDIHSGAPPLKSGRGGV